VKIYSLFEIFTSLLESFVIEGTIIGSFGSITGSIAGYFLTMYLAQKGINFEGSIKNTDLVISYVIYPDVKFSFLIISFFMATIVSTSLQYYLLYTQRDLHIMKH